MCGLFEVFLRLLRPAAALSNDQFVQAEIHRIGNANGHGTFTHNQRPVEEHVQEPQLDRFDSQRFDVDRRPVTFAALRS